MPKTTFREGKKRQEPRVDTPLLKAPLSGHGPTELVKEIDRAAHASGDFTLTIAENILMDAKIIVRGGKNHLMVAKNALTIYACALTDANRHLMNAIRPGANETRQDTADENQDMDGDSNPVGVTCL
jgi:hypothetical protein